MLLENCSPWANGLVAIVLNANNLQNIGALKGIGDFAMRQMSAMASLRNLHRSINTLIKIDVISLFIRSVGRYLNSSFLANGRSFYGSLTKQYLILVLCCGILKKVLK